MTNNARGIRINTLDSRNLVVSNTTRDNNGLNYDIASGSTARPPVANVTLVISGLASTLPTSATLELIDDTHTNPYAT